MRERNLNYADLGVGGNAAAELAGKMGVAGSGGVGGGGASDSWTPFVNAKGFRFYRDNVTGQYFWDKGENPQHLYRQGKLDPVTHPEKRKVPSGPYEGMRLF